VYDKGPLKIYCGSSTICDKENLMHELIGCTRNWGAGKLKDEM
jgi:hypothetical protein